MSAATAGERPPRPAAKHLAIVGPTATGKSAIAHAIARRLDDCEIVSLDAMQVYREMDIGTAKPSPAERAEVPYHLVDVADCADDWTVVDTQRAARGAIAAIEARGNRALLVGGTGLYVQAVVDGLEVPPTDAAIRGELEVRTATPEGLARAWAQLQAQDPVAAARIDPANQRRIVRALEVVTITGRPFSSFGPGVLHAGAPAIDIVLAGIWWTRAALARRIEQRVATMRAQGLDAEVARLRPRWSRTAAQAIGYKELAAAQLGEIALDDAYARVVARTRAFARRQRMWFRRDPRIRWIAPGRPENLHVAADAVLACWRPS